MTIIKNQHPTRLSEMGDSVIVGKEFSDKPGCNDVLLRIEKTLDLSKHDDGCFELKEKTIWELLLVGDHSHLNVGDRLKVTHLLEPI